MLTGMNFGKGYIKYMSDNLAANVNSVIEARGAKGQISRQNTLEAGVDDIRQNHIFRKGQFRDSLSHGSR